MAPNIKDFKIPEISNYNKQVVPSVKANSEQGLPSALNME